MSSQIQILTQTERKITSLEVLDQINLFRSKEGNRSELAHNDLRKIIGDELEEEILSGEISQKPLSSNGGRPMMIFELSLSQAKQILMRESRFVRKAVISYVEKLEQAIKSNFNLPQTFPQALMLAAKQAEQLETQQLQLEAQAPKVLFADAVATSENSCLVADLAKILKQKGVNNIGQNRLYTYLRDNGYLGVRGEYKNKPTQRSMDMKLFDIKKTAITKPNGEVLVTTTTKVTGKGQIYFTNKFLAKVLA